MQIDISRQKVSRYFKSHYFRWSSRTKLLAPEESLRKTTMQFPCSKNTLASLSITRPYNLLYTSENISFKIYEWKAMMTTSERKQLPLNGMKVNIFLNSWTKFPLNNSQPSKALKFNRQLLKLKKKNRQSSKPPSHWDPPCIHHSAMIIINVPMFSRKGGST